MSFRTDFRTYWRYRVTFERDGIRRYFPFWRELQIVLITTILLFILLAGAALSILWVIDRWA